MVVNQIIYPYVPAPTLTLFKDMEAVKEWAKGCRVLNEDEEEGLLVMTFPPQPKQVIRYFEFKQ
jgi:hypothetical protein